jgi:AraC-like DNA-binding protein
MTSAPRHDCRVFAFPADGIHCTQIQSERHFSRHSHATFGFGLVEQGAHRSASGQGCVDAEAGDIITNNPGEVHDGRPNRGNSRRWRMVYVDPGQFAMLGAIPPLATHGDVEFVKPVIRDRELAASIRDLVNRVEAWNDRGARTPEVSLACEEALVRTGTLLLGRHATATLQREVAGNIGRARESLADDLMQTPTLAALAATAGLSRYQLLRRFEACYGLPPHAWLRQQRADLARKLIGRGVPLVQASAASGFADQSHMTRVFAQLYGYTPGALQACRAGGTPQLRSRR